MVWVQTMAQVKSGTDGANIRQWATNRLRRRSALTEFRLVQVIKETRGEYKGPDLLASKRLAQQMFLDFPRNTPRHFGNEVNFFG